MKISTVERTAEATQFMNAMSGGKVKFYDGAVPVDPQATPAGNLLAEVVLGTPAFTTSDGVCTIIGTPNDVAIYASTVTFGRLTKSDDSAVADCTVGTSGTDLVLTKLNFVIDETVQIQSMTYTVPE